MQLLLNKAFEQKSVDFYQDNNAIFLTRKQIGEALEYKDEKSIMRLISRNKEKIGNGIPITIPLQEGTKTVAREVEVFNTKQVLKIISISKAPKAMAFMDFILDTVDQLFSGKAELKFNNPDDEKVYLKSAKSLIGTCTTLGIQKATAGRILIEAKVKGEDPNVAVLKAIQDKEELDILKRRGAIKNRVWYVADVTNPGDEDRRAKIWHDISYRLKFEIGYDFRQIRKTLKEDGVPQYQIPTYVDLIEKYDVYAEVDKILKSMLKEHDKNNK